MTEAAADICTSNAQGTVSAFLARTRESLRAQFGHDLTGPLQRIANVRAMAVPELQLLVTSGRLSILLAEELCRLDELAQREVVQEGAAVARRVAREIRVLRLRGPSLRCLCCGHALTPAEAVQELERNDGRGRERMRA